MMDIRFPMSLFGLLFYALTLAAQPVKIIYDTDMESDVDDVAATAILHVLADRGEAEILATMVSSTNPWSAPCLDAINTFYGRPDLPIGVPKGEGVNRASVYAQSVAETYPHSVTSSDSLPDAVQLYRQVLASQPDSSVVIVTVGYLTNLSRLLHTPADDFSPLNGTQLVRKKVKKYVCMGGRFPKNTNTDVHGNWKPDPEAAVDVSEHWPTPILFSGGGPPLANLYQTGSTLSAQTEPEHIVRQAYAWFFARSGWAKGPTQHSADLLAVRFAIQGVSDQFNLVCEGYNEIFANGTHEWRSSPNKDQCYITPVQEDIEEVTRELDQLMTTSPE
ncbi:MAG: nucleoside hydrolase [Cyclobacteriaceae bacterium]